MINAVIKENDGDSWYIPDEQRYNAWSSPVISGLGNIELRDFELERKFQDMRITRVEEYDRKWDEALSRSDKEYLDKQTSNITAPTYWLNWTAEELEYYEDTERFPNLLSAGYKPNWRVFQQKYNNEHKKEGNIHYRLRSINYSLAKWLSLYGESAILPLFVWTPLFAIIFALLRFHFGICSALLPHYGCHDLTSQFIDSIALYYNLQEQAQIWTLILSSELQVYL